MSSLALQGADSAAGKPSFARRAVALGARRLFEPVDPASLWVFRVVFGLTMLGATARFWANGWIEKHYLAPRFFFKFFGFEWVTAWPGHGMYVHFALMGLAALFVALGLFYRVSAAAFFLLFTYAHLIDQTHYLNHYYFVSLVSLLLVFLPLHRVGSLDRKLGLVRGPAVFPRWALWLLRFQVGAVYFFAGVAKLNGDWLLHAQPLTIWLGANTDFPVLGPLFRFKATAFAMSWAGAAFDLSVPFLLSMRRTRPFAYAAVIVFHGITGKLFPIGLFPWIMTLAALVLFPEGWPRRLVPERLAAKLWPAPAPSSDPAPEPSRRPDASPALTAGQRAVLVAIGLYAAVQVLMPLRQHLYPGNPQWTEQGFRFAWKVMLVEKNGDVEITAIDPATGKRWSVDPREHLDAYQVKQMSTQPDMILQYCRFVAAGFREKGHPDIEVHAQAHVAWNGRRPAPLLDASVDLGRERDGLSPYAFLLPAPASKPEM